MILFIAYWWHIGMMSHMKENSAFDIDSNKFWNGNCLSEYKSELVSGIGLVFGFPLLGFTHRMRLNFLSFPLEMCAKRSTFNINIAPSNFATFSVFFRLDHFFSQPLRIYWMWAVMLFVLPDPLQFSFQSNHTYK